MPVYHSIVVEADGNGPETAKTLYIIPKTNRKSGEKKRCGTFAKILAGATMALIFIFFVASLGKFLYETFGPEPEPQSYETARQFNDGSRSGFASYLTVKFAVNVIAGIIFAVLGKFVWGNDDDDDE